MKKHQISWNWLNVTNESSLTPSIKFDKNEPIWRKFIQIDEMDQMSSKFDAIDQIWQELTNQNWRKWTILEKMMKFGQNEPIWQKFIKVGCSYDELWRLWRLIHMYDRQHIDNQFQTKMALCDATIWALFAWHYHVFTSPMIYHDMNNHTFLAFRLWSSVVSVFISVITDMSPTGDLIVTHAQMPSPVAPKLHFFGCSSPFWGNARKRYFHSAFNVSRLWHVSCREGLP